jgi:uncharacterized protein (DUF2384 family)
MTATAQSTRPLQLTKDTVVNYAHEVFGDSRQAFSWLRTPNPLFCGMCPKDLLELGDARDISNVYSELGRIDQVLF